MSDTVKKPHLLYWGLTPEPLRFALVVHGLSRMTPEGAVSALKAACTKDELREILAGLADVHEKV
jgi:hypothetical protein